MKQLLIFGLLLCLAFTVLAGKEKPKKEKTPAVLTEDQYLAAAEKEFNFQTGKITIGNNLATLDLSANYRYLNADQTDRVLTEFWGNPPGNKSLGMIVPSDVSPLSEKGWGVIISYEEDGHVEDSDAAGINYNDLLREMQTDLVEENEARKSKGFGTYEIIGWAESPHYDSAARKLYWAKNLRFSDAPDNTLNYDVRILGRTGILSLNAVSTMPNLPQIQTSMQEILPSVEFNAGNRYADYNSGVDKMAAYGIGALVAGKLAAKAGFFTVILGFLLAAKKFIIIGVIAVGGFLARIFFGNKSDSGN